MYKNDNTTKHSQRKIKYLTFANYRSKKRSYITVTPFFSSG